MPRLTVKNDKNDFHFQKKHMGRIIPGIFPRSLILDLSTILLVTLKLQFSLFQF